MDAVKQDLQTLGQITLCFFVGFDGAAGHVQQLAAVFFHHAKAGGAKPRVNAKNAHLRQLCAAHAHQNNFGTTRKVL